jgi:hypothetical protein
MKAEAGRIEDRIAVWDFWVAGVAKRGTRLLAPEPNRKAEPAVCQNINFCQTRSIYLACEILCKFYKAQNRKVVEDIVVAIMGIGSTD